MPGNEFHITVAPKGFGSENKSGLKMLTPSAGIKGIKQFVIDTIFHAGGNPCPPIIVGIGIGGTMERAAYLSKKALLRPVGSVSEMPHVAKLEKELLDEINKLGIGPMWFWWHNYRPTSKHSHQCHAHCWLACIGKHWLPCYTPCRRLSLNTTNAL